MVLLEANRIGWRPAGNGGQLIRGIGHDTSQPARWIARRGVRELDLMGLEAVQLVRERAARFNIDCDLTWGYSRSATSQCHLKGFERMPTPGQPGPLARTQAGPQGETRSVVGSGSLYRRHDRHGLRPPGIPSTWPLGEIARRPAWRRPVRSSPG